MDRIIRLFDRLIYALIVSATAGMLVIICLQVFFRFILNNALSWPEEASRFLMIWALFLAAGYALKDDEHVGLTFFIGRLPARYRSGLRMILHLAVVGFLVVMVYGGWLEMVSLYPLKTGALRISRAIPYSIIPISGILFIIISIRLFIEDSKQLRPK
jgi:TRAP-type transport system small permease protein